MSFGPTGFSITTSERGGRVIVLIRGELDLATAPELETAIGESVDAGHDVVVDLRELEFMDSSGLRVLVSAHKRAQSGPRFQIVRPPAGGPVAKILGIAGVEGELDLIDDL
jgi:anti-sigma B factor antagonist